MSKTNPNISGIIIEYNSGMIPAPFSHVFRLALDWSDGRLMADLDLHYTDREDLSEEEIFDEGFTLEDDYKYKGEINAVWIPVILRHFDHAKWSGKSREEGGVVLTPMENGNLSELKIPSDQESWQLLAQDLIQAIYETSKKEAPLTIQYRQVTHEEKPTDCSIQVRFSDREVLFTLDGKTRNINWEYAVELLKVVFTPDYDYELAKEKPGTKRGNYIECGDGLWHELGKGVINIDESYDAVGKIKSGFEELIGK